MIIFRLIHLRVKVLSYTHAPDHAKQVWWHAGKEVGIQVGNRGLITEVNAGRALRMLRTNRDLSIRALAEKRGAFL